ncbi:hypothetical protein [Methanobrevibacter sp.]
MKSITLSLRCPKVNIQKVGNLFKGKILKLKNHFFLAFSSASSLSSELNLPAF